MGLDAGNTRRDLPVTAPEHHEFPHNGLYDAYFDWLVLSDFFDHYNLSDHFDHYNLPVHVVLLESFDLTDIFDLDNDIGNDKHNNRVTNNHHVHIHDVNNDHDKQLLVWVRTLRQHSPIRGDTLLEHNRLDPQRLLLRH